MFFGANEYSPDGSWRKWGSFIDEKLMYVLFVLSASTPQLSVRQKSAIESKIPRLQTVLPKAALQISYCNFPTESLLDAWAPEKWVLEQGIQPQDLPKSSQLYLMNSSLQA